MLRNHVFGSFDFELPTYTLKSIFSRESKENLPFRKNATYTRTH